MSDIHGCFDEFMEMLELIKFTPKTDALYILGDVIDRGDKSLECVEHIKRRQNLSSKGKSRSAYGRLLP